MLCLTPAPLLAGSHPLLEAGGRGARTRSTFWLTRTLPRSPGRAKPRAASPAWRGGSARPQHLASLIGCKMSTISGEKGDGRGRLTRGGAPFCVCFCFAVACQQRVPRNVFCGPVLRVAETTTRDWGVFGFDSDLSIGIEFSATSEAAAVGAVIALPESQTRNPLY